jgi:hypothetical protein
MLTKSVVAGGGAFNCEVPGKVLHAECGHLGAGPRAPITFQFWYEGSLSGEGNLSRTFQTVRTGVVVPEGSVYCKSARDVDGGAWHLYELFEGGS